MMKWATLCTLPMLAAAGIDYTQEQSHKESNWKAASQWVCGNAVNTKAHNPLAGVLPFVDGTLDWIRSDPAETAAMTPEELATVQSKSFSDLFCYDYLKRYMNPTSTEGEPVNRPGVCIRDRTVGKKWLAILETDAEVKKEWEMFGTKYGYQKSVAKFKEMPEDDGNIAWGSGRQGSNPSNWCGAYMGDMLCHVAFPQFADTDSSLALPSGEISGLGSLVRPVCSSECESLMDICNRHEPDPYTGVAVPWLQGFETEEEDLDNVFYCKAWNKGYHLARAGTGIGSGDDDNDDLYCAQFDSSSSLTPMMAFAVLASFIALLL